MGQLRPGRAWQRGAICFACLGVRKIDLDRVVVQIKLYTNALSGGGLVHFMLIQQNIQSTKKHDLLCVYCVS